MKQFVDSNGRTWAISMTIDAVKRCRDLLGVNLMEPESGDPPLITRIGTDEILLCDLIYCLVKPEADRQEISDEEFGRAMGGDAILHAQNAFYEEMIDFFLQRGRADRAKAMQKQQEVISLAVEKVATMMEMFDGDGEVEKAFGSLSTTLRASSGSTPAH